MQIFRYKQIKAIHFTVLRARDIIGQSVCAIDNTQTYDNDGMPTLGGINDPRMGPVDYTMICQTCS
jgi:DNA-directed RNA polymerase beta' subunit